MKISNNRHLDALLKLILLSAVLHIIVLVIYSIRVRSILPLNYFNILDFDLFYPAMIYGGATQAIAGALVLGLWIILYLFFTKK